MTKKVKTTTAEVVKKDDAQVAMPQTTKSLAENLIAQAIDKNVPVETMEKLLAMRRELRAEEAKTEYDMAMAKFQADCPTITKTKEVKTSAGKLAYKYAPIESIVDQVKHILQRHGFSYATGMELLGDGVKVTVKVTHEGGHSEESSMQVPFGQQTNIMSKTQVAAAAQTFAKRYAFCNAFGIMTGDDDDDAQSTKTPPPQKPAPAKQLPKQGPTNEQTVEFGTLLAELGKPLTEKTEKWWENLTPAEAQKNIEALKKENRKDDDTPPPNMPAEAQKPLQEKINAEVKKQDQPEPKKPAETKLEPKSKAGQKMKEAMDAQQAIRQARVERSKRYQNLLEKSTTEDLTPEELKFVNDYEDGKFEEIKN